MRMRPASGRTRPERIPMSVDFPAPFSPSRQWTSPRRTLNVTSSFASTPGYAFVTPTSSTRGGVPFVGSPERLLRCSFTPPRPRRGGDARGNREGSPRTSAGRFALPDQLEYGGLRRHVRHLDGAADDPELRLADLLPDGGRDVLRAQERDTAVLEGELVPVGSVGTL